MNRTINFKLNSFPQTPALLRANPQTGNSLTRFSFNLARLFHHYYLDGYGATPPNPDYSNLEYLQFLTASNDFRFLGNGPGVNTQKKRTISQELGQAFCRLFLHDFCGIVYFAHMDKIIDKTIHPAFSGISIKRISKGDVPDYFCAKSSQQFYIGEAKGRYSSINFTTTEFNNWRDQFKRIHVLGASGNPIKTKGFIVATRFATENHPNVFSELLAEDPETNGSELTNDSIENINFYKLIIINHYGRILSRMGLNLVSNSLIQGFELPAELTYNLPVWQCLAPPFLGRLFVGGYFAQETPKFITNKNMHFFSPDILKINSSTPFFIGLELSVVKSIFQACRGNWNILNEIRPSDAIDFGISDFAWSNDNTVSGSLQYFALVNINTF